MLIVDMCSARTRREIACICRCANAVVSLYLWGPFTVSTARVLQAGHSCARYPLKLGRAVCALDHDSMAHQAGRSSSGREPYQRLGHAQGRDVKRADAQLPGSVQHAACACKIRAAVGKRPACSLCVQNQGSCREASSMQPVRAKSGQLPASVEHAACVCEIRAAARKHPAGSMCV